MKVIDPGHRYSLTNLDARLTDPENQMLYFVKRVGRKYPGNSTFHAGTTSQEVLRALVERARYLNRQTWCVETRVSVFLLSLVIYLYERRAAKRHGRRSPSFDSAIDGNACAICGHIGCSGGCLFP